MVVDLRLSAKWLGREGLELEIGAADVVVKEHEAREVDGAFAAEDLVFVEFEVDAQALDDLGVCAGLDFEADGVALAAVVELDANGFKQRARFFFFEVEVGVAGDAEAGVGEDLVAAVHAGEVLGDEVLEEQVVVCAVLGGKADEAWQGAGHGDDAEDLGSGAAALGAEQQRQAKSLVEDAGKGVGGVDGDGGQERIDFALEVVLGKGAGIVARVHPSRGDGRPACAARGAGAGSSTILGVDKGVDFGGEGVEGLVGAEAVVAGLAVAVFNALHEAGLADFDVLVEVGAGDGEELDALEERVGGVFGFFEDAAIELHPGVVAAVKELLFLRSSGHG